MKIVQITTDNRDHFKEHHLDKPWFGTAPEALLQGFALLPEHEVHVVSCTRKAMRSPEKLADNIWFHSVCISKWGMMRSLYAEAVLALRSKIKEINPDIVHGQGTERECALAAVFSGYPNVITIHGNMNAIRRLGGHGAPIYFFLASHLENLALRRTDGVVCITRYTLELVQAKTRRTWVLPNAVDSRYFQVSPASHLNSPLRLICVGTICPRKNQLALLKVLSQLRPAHSIQIRFLGQVNGQTDYGGRFLETVTRLEWAEHGGFVGRDELAQELAQADGLILPSLEDNCPMVILEAQAAGVPVAASHVGGVPDLIEDGQTGVLFHPQDSDHMRSSLEAWIRTRELRQRTAEKARIQAQQRFHPKAIAEKHVEIYREVLSGKAKA
jgi:glycosyltransferase involved in cell wall biosynthesis